MARLWRFDETIDTDVLAPGKYMKSPLEELATHCLEAVRPEFAGSVRAGDVMLLNMGAGSSREQAAEVLKHLGIAVIAPSFAGIFYRNAINLGLPVFTIDAGLHSHPGLTDGAEIIFDFGSASVTVPASGEVLNSSHCPISADMILDGGLIPHLEKARRQRRRRVPDVDTAIDGAYYPSRPGDHDALSGLIATQAGAKAVYLSGASLVDTRFGRSDIGLVSVSEVHDTPAITDRIDTPVIVDADNGFGNALNVQMTARYFERAGAAAIQLEDQPETLWSS